MNNKITIVTILILLNFFALSAMEEEKTDNQDTSSQQPYWTFNPVSPTDPEVAKQAYRTYQANAQKRNPNRKFKAVIF